MSSKAITRRASFRSALMRALLIPSLLSLVLAGLFFVQINYLMSMARQVERSDSMIATANEIAYLFMENRILWQKNQMEALSASYGSPTMSLNDLVQLIDKLDIMSGSDEPEQRATINQLKEEYLQWTALAGGKADSSKSSHEREDILSRKDRSEERFRNLIRAFVVVEESLRKERLADSKNATKLVTTFGIGLAVLIGSIFGIFTRAKLLALGRSYDDAMSAVELQARDLASANKSKNMFLANMSHEMRTPLSAIIGFSKMALARGSLSAEVRDALLVVRRNAVHLHKLINDLLDISKIEAGRIQISKSRIFLSALIDEVVVNFMRSFEEKGIEFKIVHGPNVPEVIHSDPVRLGQIITNLVGNALKFTDRGEVRLETEFEPAVDHSKGGRLFLRIYDTGIGIPSDKINSLFQPFIQVDNSDHRQYTGTGLGLAISRELARALGGNLILEKSQWHRGSVFRLSLPIEATLVTRTPLVSVKTSDDRSWMDGSPKTLAGLRILVAEDSRDLQILIQKLLTLQGADVTVVEDGVGAVSQALASPFDVILMDVHMPNKDGLTATRELRAMYYSSPILALTAHASDEERQRCLEAGCDDHIPKPVDADVLVTRILKNTQKNSGPSNIAEVGV